MPERDGHVAHGHKDQEKPCEPKAGQQPSCGKEKDSFATHRTRILRPARDEKEDDDACGHEGVRDNCRWDLPVSGGPQMVKTSGHLRFRGNPAISGAFVEALFRTRTGDPLLTMEVLYQLS
jgi:hypothetical protein